ncbi:MAG: hypothetical protein A2145_02565 [candidate division Zixibacteria bacterium RBG_16_40_9]|nr:MAG: hypothetical protein A2145_02565 [candidate division Zixibacteria bacterium RBG_16_40_9]
MILVEVSVLGAILAFIFAISMGGLLWWMLHPPAMVGAAVAKARRSIGAIKRILVPTTGMPYSERGVEMACRLGLEQNAEIVLTYVIEVPRTLPLGVPLAEAEKEAQQALERAKEIVELHELTPITLLERAREAAEGIIRIAKEKEVDLIVLGIRSKLTGAQHLLGRTSDTLLRRAPCEVLLDKLPE